MSGIARSVTERLFRRACLVIFVATACGEAPDHSPSRTLAEAEYSDPKGFFSMTPPHGWRIREYPEDPRGKVAFEGPDGVALNVLTNGVPYSDVASLENELRTTSARSGLDMRISTKAFNGRSAVEREFVAQGSRVLMIDFLAGNTAHNLMFSGPRGNFERHLGAVTASLATYQPVDQDLTDWEVLENILAKDRRLGRLLIDQGSYEEALVHIRHGLGQSSEDSVLLRLRDEATEARAR